MAIRVKFCAAACILLALLGNAAAQSGTFGGTLYTLMPAGMNFNELGAFRRGCPAGTSFSSYKGSDKVAADALAAGQEIWVDEVSVNGLAPFKQAAGGLGYKTTQLLPYICKGTPSSSPSSSPPTSASLLIPAPASAGHRFALDDCTRRGGRLAGYTTAHERALMAAVAASYPRIWLHEATIAGLCPILTNGTAIVRELCDQNLPYVCVVGDGPFTTGNRAAVLPAGYTLITGFTISKIQDAMDYCSSRGLRLAPYTGFTAYVMDKAAVDAAFTISGRSMYVGDDTRDGYCPIVSAGVKAMGSCFQNLAFVCGPKM